MSLLFTLQGMRERGHQCVVALARPAPALLSLYREAGFETLAWPGLTLWDHSTVAPRPLLDPRTWLLPAALLRGWRRTGARTRELVRTVQPDIVHLNSMPFVLSAEALRQDHVPFIWHVREPPPDQGLRTRVIRAVMLRSPQLIFISHFDRQQWVHDRAGEVIYNFVELERFRSELDGQAVRRSLRIPAPARVILYLGGVVSVKGFFVLIEALRILKEQGLAFVCLMPGTEYGVLRSWQGRLAGKVLPWFGTGTPKQLAARTVAAYGLEPYLRALPFATDVAPLFAAADVVVFPATRPHFARPVIESIAMQKPAIGSDLGGVRELLALHPLGRSVPPGDAQALAAAIRTTFAESPDLHKLEDRFVQVRSLFDRSSGVVAIEALYRRVLEATHA